MDQNIPLPDGESVSVSYVPKGGQSRVQDPARMQPVEPPADQPVPTTSSHMRTWSPGDDPLLPPMPESAYPPGATPLEPLARELLHPRGARPEPEVPVGPATVTSEGALIVNGEVLPSVQMLAPVRVEHVDCNDTFAEVTATYLVPQVEVEPDGLRWIEEIPHHESREGCVCQLTGQQAVNIDMINRTREAMRRFVLQRDRDDTGISGTGIVAEGVVLSDGRVVVRWVGSHSSIVMWDSVQTMIDVHGHHGHTRLRWLDHGGRTLTLHPDAP